MDHVNERVEQIISKHIGSLLESKRIERMILNAISDFIKNGKIDHWLNTTSFQDCIDRQLKSVINEILKEKYNIKLELNINDEKKI